MSMRHSRRPEIRPSINVTPLVDVVLVLLIIFMVVTPQLENDVELDLPAIFNVDPDAKKQADPLEISVDREGRVHVDGNVLEAEPLAGYLSRVRADNPRKKLAIRADRKQRFSDVRQVFQIVREAGFPSAVLIVSESQEDG
ncbi:MAG: biopolymer transporter ExbD [Candidatus Dadabacteria bacterium]|nr:MAG: biopolymer transporter ExbD [Candidatus Dadabacteria bacterium]